MELNINSPIYYKDIYGIDDEVYKYCQIVYSNFLDKDYSDTLKTIGIIPIIVPNDLCGKKYKSKVKFLCNKTVASVEIIIDFDDYCNSDIEGKIAIIKKTILLAVNLIAAKTNFDFEKFSIDLQNIML